MRLKEDRAMIISGKHWNPGKGMMIQCQATKIYYRVVRRLEFNQRDIHGIWLAEARVELIGRDFNNVYWEKVYWVERVLPYKKESTTFAGEAQPPLDYDPLQDRDGVFYVAPEGG